MAVSAVSIAAFALPPYLTGNPADATLPLDPDVALHYLSLVAHAVPGGLALILGPLQFLTPLRNRRPRLHRITGRVYMISVVAGSIMAFFAATFSVNGLPAQISFYLLAVAWLYSLYMAYVHIRRGDVQMHRVWMIRNYALTLAAVSLRVFLLIGMALMPSFPSLEFGDVYTSSAWAAIMINIVVAEYFVVHRVLNQMTRRRRRPESTASAAPAAAPLA
ncbi:DUF2306 domain-containing protein [Spongiactinospora sp. TRM90649]|uniref:DUF2306 domain-containing protein n=1 Tax=Spongiactinospora sp. TRM90649 TaxID=3031114 RepID=UPI0023F6D998|nr:DUF2306 domain-containing protein [Spongiactinospora sp. TRM90649]MDF5751559.1 DUF2306 domain-containing protein [Spongiactinospora sp. TRM90649]